MKNTQEKKNLESFKRGVNKQAQKDGILDEYTPDFWGNVFGDEFCSEEDAFICGQEAVSNR